MAESGEGEEILTHAVRANRGSGGVKSGAAQQQQQQLGMALTLVRSNEPLKARYLHTACLLTGVVFGDLTILTPSHPLVLWPCLWGWRRRR